MTAGLGDMKMPAAVFRFPTTPEGRQLLKDMLRGEGMCSLLLGLDPDTCDFDDLATELEDGYAAYIDYLESRGLDDLNASEKAELTEWKREQSGKRLREREWGGK